MKWRAGTIFASVALSLVVSQTPVNSVELEPLQVWTVNIFEMRKEPVNELNRGWQGVIEQMALSPRAPDIVLVQDIGQGNPQQVAFEDALENKFPSAYSSRHSLVSGAVPGQAVYWNTSRLQLSGDATEIERWSTQATNCPLEPNHFQKTQVAVDLIDQSTNQHVVAASFYRPPSVKEGFVNQCLNAELNIVNNKLDNLAATRRLSFISGDFNTRPDNSGEQPLNGLEANPDCWYQSMSKSHPGGCSPGHDRYHDTVWLQHSGLSNPAAPAICEQYTRKFFNPPNIVGQDLSTSCTDIFKTDGSPGPDNPPKLDKARIDYLWVGWENMNGSVWPGQREEAAARVVSASADVGFDVTTGQEYSDHRAVSALVRYNDGE